MGKVTFLSFVLIFLIIFTAGGKNVFAQSNEFSYQGFLSDTSASANGNFDFEFRLYSAAAGGVPQSTIQRLNVPVTNGVFSVTLDFGAAAFPGADRFLEIAVKPSGGGGATTLAPRQKIGRTPYSISSSSALLADNSLQLGGVAAGQYVLTNDSRLSDARNPLPNSTSYVQNRTTQQSSTNFNISGNGTVSGTLTGGIVSASTQYNMGTNRILAKVGVNNLFLGTLAGNSDGGIQNTLVGDSAGRDNIGDENSFFGFIAGQFSTTGNFNTIIGSRAGRANLTGSKNTFLGYTAEAGSSTLTNATAIGANAFVEQSNSIVLGSINGVNGATATTDVGIGITQPARRLDVNGNIRVGTTTGTIGCIEDRDGTVIAGTCSSDIRFKKGITPISSILNNFARLRPVNFYWRRDEFEDQKWGANQSFGLIAQEVEAAFPELVSTDEKGFKLVNYSKLPLYTIQAVNELIAHNDGLKTEIEAQKKQLEKQQSEIDELKRIVSAIRTNLTGQTSQTTPAKKRAVKANRR